jgi:hypothetical protein
MKHLIALLVLACVACTNVYEGDMYEGELVGQNKEKPKDGWSQSGTLTQGDAIKTVSFQANFPVADYYTLQFNVTAPNDPQVPWIPQALIQWSVEGNTVTRIIDIGNGVAISGAAQGVKVIVSDVSTLGIPADARDYGVSIQCTKGSRPSSANGPTLRAPEGVQSLAGAGSVKFDIPANSGVKAAMVFVAPASNPATPMQALMGIDAVGVVSLKWNPNENVGWIPVTPGATDIIVENFDAISMDISVVYEIEG